MYRMFLRIASALSLCALIIVPLSSQVHAADPVAKTFFGGVAIEGFDAMSYRTAGKPLEGADTFETEWRGATWRFASAADRDRFAATPTAFAPAYGGHCANAMSMGKLVKADPEIWRIIGDRLFVYYAERGRKAWQGNEETKMSAADANWRKMFPNLGD